MRSKSPAVETFRRWMQSDRSLGLDGGPQSDRSLGLDDRPHMLWLAICCLLALWAALAGASSALANAPAEVQSARAAPGLSRAQAEKNLAVQHQGTKVNIVGELEKTLGEFYAGVWFDTEAGEFVVPIAVAGSSQVIREKKQRSRRSRVRSCVVTD
jgi:hypothetical protein